jgi:flagellar basal body rod protein FlgG
MLSGLNAAMSALNAGRTVAAINANNIANANTSGYRPRQAHLAEAPAHGGVRVASVSVDNLSPLYTRSGVFQRNYGGDIVDPRGRPLFNGIKEGVTVGEDGTLYDYGEPVGRIQMFDGVGNPIVVGSQHIVTGMIAMSNVSLANEAVTMILNQRAFEANAVSVKTHDSMMGTIFNMKA